MSGPFQQFNRETFSSFSRVVTISSIACKFRCYFDIKGGDFTSSWLDFLSISRRKLDDTCWFDGDEDGDDRLILYCITYQYKLRG
jgi:hypothetical protein